MHGGRKEGGGGGGGGDFYDQTLCSQVYGPSHPKTKRAKGTLEEPMYAKIRMQLEQKGHLDAQ